MTGSGGGSVGRGRGLLNLFYIWIVTSALFWVKSLGSLFDKEKSDRGESALGGKGTGTRRKTIGFFHPYCNAGGGGERVLWAALRSLQQSTSGDTHHFVVYTGDVEATPEEILAKARNHFNIRIHPENVEFVKLRRRHWVEAEPYPVFTMLGQALGSLYLGLEALDQFNPDVFIDTMGYAWTLPLFRYLGGCRVGAYVHYPTISTDMLRRVEEGRAGHNNAEVVARSPVLSGMKLIYYRLFAWAYSKAGRCSEVTMVNSSWTEGHILKLWQRPGVTFKVYPPCDVEEFKQLQRQDKEEKETVNLISVAQFRPEKDHALQIRAMARLREKVAPKVWDRLRLVLLGSVRNGGDEGRVEGLKRLAEELGLEGNVRFEVNFKFEKLKEELVGGLIGLHSMWNEHFGISVVECMAAGLLMIAHNSGGPLMDIVVTSPQSKRNGFLAETEEEYAEFIKQVLEMSGEEQEAIRKRGRSSVDRFSDQEFGKRFREVMEGIL